MQALCFHYHGRNFCVRTSEISEVLESVNCLALPRVPAAFDGIFQLRGRVVTLLNFLRCFELNQEETASSQILILAEPRNHFAVRVPGVVESISLNAGEIEKSPVEQNSFHSVLEGTVSEGQKILSLLSTEKIFQHACELVKQGSTA